MDRLLRAGSLIGTVVMLLTMASLHFLEPELNPVTQVMSYYGPGPYGYVFTLSLAALSVGLVAFAGLLQRALNPEQRTCVAISFVGVASASALVVALSNADLPNAPHTLHGMLHGLGALFFWTAFPVAAIDLSSRLRQRDATRALGRLSLMFGVLSIIELTLSLAVSPLGGLLERTLLLTDAAWVVLVAVAVARASGHSKA